VEAISKQQLKPLGAAGTNKRLWYAVAHWYQWKLFQMDLYQWCWEAFMMLLDQPIRAYGSLGLMPIVEHHAKLLQRKYQKSGYLL
jgi:muconolactone delta-isomerase